MLTDFVSNSENCRRITLIHGLGGGDLGFSEICDICIPSAISFGDRLNILQIGKPTKHKKKTCSCEIYE